MGISSRSCVRHGDNWKPAHLTLTGLLSGRIEDAEEGLLANLGGICERFGSFFEETRGS